MNSNIMSKWEPQMAKKPSGGKGPPPKQTSPRISTIAGKTLAGYKPSRSEVLSLAGAALVQDQTKGQKPKGR
jgi:hypothetical protein